VKIIAGLAAGALIGAVIACGGNTPGPNDPGLPLRVEVANLWTQIRQWRSEAHMELDPPNQLIAWVNNKTVGDVKRKVCREGQTEVPACNDICSIADNICDNAERICQIADQLGKSDDFAQEKCTSAKASCREAKQNCCGCTEKAASTNGGTW
jgi:hypothetical protein